MGDYGAGVKASSVVLSGALPAGTEPGAYPVNWHSKDSRCRQVPHGDYFYRPDTPGFRDVKKEVVAR